MYVQIYVNMQIRSYINTCVQKYWCTLVFLPLVIDGDVQGVAWCSQFRAYGQDTVLGFHACTYDGAVGDIGVIHAGAEVGGTYLDAEVLRCVVAEDALPALPVAAGNDSLFKQPVNL